MAVPCVATAAILSLQTALPRAFWQPIEDERTQMRQMEAWNFPFGSLGMCWTCWILMFASQPNSCLKALLISPSSGTADGNP